ncbi:hypothetical protein [Burkholderia pseudomallei]|uniref:hypothetical protein n=1 Tax=Burkholderia pseudomallei TaxID=28450 RepID=UPI000A1A2EF3|nr:hypothetical protein [Burkholderia pseudomallei]ARL77584.1 hypothetical protein BOC54_36925 [Burkholderia pseudomallei]ARL84189.1 hypothetical protein BOC55_35250 [Burkholderia pseudomallei]
MDIDGQLCSWTIYDHPLDYPDGFVARMFVGEKPTNAALYGRTLDAVRAVLAHMLPDLYCMPRHAGDEPHIVETWL